MATINDLSTGNLIKIFSYLDIRSLQRCRRGLKTYKLSYIHYTIIYLLFLISIIN